MTKIKILTGSNRPGRFNIQPATWIYELAKKRTDIEVELIDLQEVGLPFLDEPKPAMQNEYQNDHTKTWSKQIANADGFIFVTPEYNHSYSAILKNAIDYLYKEWNYKPVSFVSYGAQAGGSRAVEHLRGVAAQVKMYDLFEQVSFPSYYEHVDAQGKYQFTEQQSEFANALIDSLSFWALQMKEARAKMAQ